MVVRAHKNLDGLIRYVCIMYSYIIMTTLGVRIIVHYGKYLFRFNV